MKKQFLAVVCLGLFLSGCAGKNVLPPEEVLQKSVTDILRKGDLFSVTGIVDYSDEPSDIGQEYCFITGSDTIEYYYIDIYDQESKWESNIFYTYGEDTALLKEYVGQEVTVAGAFDAESHGIPYITNITIHSN